VPYYFPRELEYDVGYFPRELEYDAGYFRHVYDGVDGNYSNLPVTDLTMIFYSRDSANGSSSA